MNRAANPALYGFSFTVLPGLLAAVAAAFLLLPHEPQANRYLAVLPLAYLLGSIPWGYLLLRWRLGVDVRDYGSGRTGVTNVLRTGGLKLAGLSLLLDMSKGLVAVWLAQAAIGTPKAAVAAGLLALMGHNWPVFLQFRGGRGIATGFGGLLAIAPLAVAPAALAFAVTVWATRYVSLGSVLGALVAMAAVVALAAAGVYTAEYLIYVALGGGVVIWQHRDNISRLLNGTERKIGQSAR